MANTTIEILKKIEHLENKVFSLENELKYHKEILAFLEGYFHNDEKFSHAMEMAKKLILKEKP